MSWLRVDDGFPEHPKVVCLKDADIGAWLRLACWCARVRNEGAMSRDAAVKKIGRATLTRLIGAGLIDDSGETVTIHDFTAYNPTAEEAEKVRTSRVEAGRRGGLQKQANRLAKPEQGPGEVVANDQQTGSKPPSKTLAKPCPVPVPHPLVASNEATERARTGDSHGILVTVSVDWEPSKELLDAVEMLGVPRAFAAEVSLPVFRAHNLGEEIHPDQLAKRWRTWCLNDKTRKLPGWLAERDAAPRSGARRTPAEQYPEHAGKPNWCPVLFVLRQPDGSWLAPDGSFRMGPDEYERKLARAKRVAAERGAA